MQIRTLMLGLALATSAVMAPPAGAQNGGTADPRIARVQAELQALRVEMAAAVARGDRAALERIFAPEYVHVHATGFQADRAEHITDLLAPDSASRASFAAGVARGERMADGPSTELHVYGDVVVRRQRNVTPMGRPLPFVTVYVKRDGRWQFAHAQSTLLQRERPAVTVAAALLDAYVGNYQSSSGSRMSIYREGTHLVARGVPVPFPRVLTPVADTVLYDKLGNAFTFSRGADGRAARVTMRWEHDPPFIFERQP